MSHGVVFLSTIERSAPPFDRKSRQRFPFAGDFLLRRLLPKTVRLEQPVQMDDDIFHLGVVDGALGGAAPGFFGAGVAVEQADEDRKSVV